MTDYRIRNTETGEMSASCSDVAVARRKFVEQRKAELNASRADKQVNALRVVDGAKYEVVEWDHVRGVGDVFETFGLIASWYAPTAPRTSKEYDGRQSDWQSGKFHR